MDIGEGSFYNTLKSKKSLYVACLRHYNDTVGRKRIDALLSPPSAKKGARGLFKTVLDGFDDPKAPRTCLLARSVSTDVLVERDLFKVVQEDRSAVVEAFADRLKAGKEAGELPPRFDADGAAQIIATYLQGLLGTALLGYNRPRLERQIEQFLKGVGL
jgi:TetR/AcrR family transcriptional regulator, transcriptional repressor for nem operon